jgi:hypothetical protein
MRFLRRRSPRKSDRPRPRLRGSRGAAAALHQFPASCLFGRRHRRHSRKTRPRKVGTKSPPRTPKSPVFMPSFCATKKNEEETIEEGACWLIPKCWLALSTWLSGQASHVTGTKPCLTALGRRPDLVAGFTRKEAQKTNGFQSAFESSLRDKRPMRSALQLNSE